jgi:hypothetical protein
MAVMMLVKPASEARQSPATVNARLARSISTVPQPTEPARSPFQ